MRGEINALDDQARQTAGGSFVQLSDGITHYELANPDKEHTVILVHGFSVPYFIYDPTFEFLVQSGFRTIRYDLFGRGYSDRPGVKYNLEFFVRQLGDLLDELRLASTHPPVVSASSRPVSLIGLSMGGPIAAAFTLRNPHRVDKLILIGPTGARPIELSPLLKAAKIPVLAEAFLALTGTGFLVESAANDFFDPALVAHFQRRYKVQMQYKGFGRAILSTIRSDMLGSFIDIYRGLGTMNKRVLLFWGRNDKTVPYEHSTDLIAAIPQAEFHIIEHCGHIPHYEKPDEVNPILLEFLRKT